MKQTSSPEHSRVIYATLFIHTQHVISIGCCWQVSSDCMFFYDGFSLTVSGDSLAQQASDLTTGETQLLDQGFINSKDTGS